MADAHEMSNSGMTPEDLDVPKRISFKDVPNFKDVPADQTPENFLLDNLVRRPRALSHHLSSTKVPSREWLKIQARFWRTLMKLGMRFHNWKLPYAPKPDFVRTIGTDTIPIELCFYVPRDYFKTEEEDPEHRYPLVVNYHGGGFTLGGPQDDRYYARIILQETKAVYVSVGYRRAPEHPFPQPVDDCVESLMYLSTHSTDLRIDPGKTCLTGFSAGGNLAFTVPFRLTYHTNPKRPRLYPGPGSQIYSLKGTPPLSRTTVAQTIHTIPEGQNEDNDMLNPRSAATATVLLEVPHNSNSNYTPPGSRPSTPVSSDHAVSRASTRDISYDNNPSVHDFTAHHNTIRFTPSTSGPPGHHGDPSDSKGERHSDATSSKQHERPTLQSRQSTFNPDRPSNLKILSIVAWYPLLDWTSSRSAKVRSSIKPSATLNKTFTDLFDYSYLPPPDHANDHVSPYASPALAPDHMIADGLPTKIQLYLCEYDMLLSEGHKFRKRLEDFQKEVTWQVVDKAPHGWDKSPSPFRDQKKIDSLYIEAARKIQETFDEATYRPEDVRGERIGLGGLR